MSFLPWADFAVNLLLCAAAVAGYFALVMAAALRLRKHAIVDVFWGPGFVLVAAISYLASAHAGGDPWRRATVVVLTAIWGLRLATHIAVRNTGQGEDKRYTAILGKRTGSLLGYVARTIYLPQALILFVVSLPVQLAMYESAPLGVLGAVGIAVWCVGFFFEAVGDAQLARFTKNPSNAGKVMDLGLWAWTRHPNYFGDACVWFGIWLLALGHPAGLLTVVSPVAMTYFLVNVTGKALLEKGMRRSRGAAYEDYVARTSGFFPLPPRR
jgi:steroid 5-alpha reductase family enzyme